MSTHIEEVKNAFHQEVDQIHSLDELEQLRIKYLGKKGIVNGLMRHLRELPNEEKPLFGQMVNELKNAFNQTIDQHHDQLNKLRLDQEIKATSVDVTAPGRRQSYSTEHILRKTMQMMLDALISMGFSIQPSPELETEYYNYGGLNYPDDHPARDMQDTYYIADDLLLRSHTTNIQQHLLQTHSPPIRVACPGKCYRNETISTRSHVIFHQIDVFYVDTDVSMRDLLAAQREFYGKIFNRQVDVRVRPSYFPFVEPGLEVDVHCLQCGGKGCKLCKNTGWLEVAGAGMVHPKIIQDGGLDPNAYTGFAWGGGVERVCMLLHGISDIRLFLENDLRFLRQFG